MKAKYSELVVLKPVSQDLSGFKDPFTGIPYRYPAYQFVTLQFITVAP